MREQKYWMLVASKDHVQKGIAEGIAQACHGKMAPLKRMKPGDGVIYYSPRVTFQEKELCQQFTAIGTVVGEAPYEFAMHSHFKPFRLDVVYKPATPVAIQSLLNHLQFIENKKSWGYQFRFGFFEISAQDYATIAKAMQASR